MKELNARFLSVGGPTRVEEDSSLVAPLIDGQDYFGAVQMEIGRTQGPGDAIYMLGWRFESTFRFSNDPAQPAELGRVLAIKAAAGVDVRVILPLKWQLYNRLESEKEADLRAKGNNDLVNLLDWFGPSGNLRHADLLRKQSVDGKTPLDARVLLDHSSELFGIHHQKMVLVHRAGAAVGFVAGIDFLADRLDTQAHDESLPRSRLARPKEPFPYYWHDAGTRIEGPVLSGLFYYFGLRWFHCLRLMDRKFSTRDGQTINSLNPRVEMTAPRSRPDRTPLSGPPLTGVFIAANFPERDVAGAHPAVHQPHDLFGQKPIHTTGDLYKKAIGSARRFIYVEDQYFDAPCLEGALREAARRGVKIIAVLGGWSDDDRKEVEPKWTSPFLKSLGDSVAVMFVKKTIVHSKLMVIDDEFAAIGSTNFADRSLVEAEDKGGGAESSLRALLKEVKQDWSTDSELTVAMVDDRANDTNVARRLRVLLWAEHLRVSPYDTSIWAQLADLRTGLSVFEKSWGRPVSFSHADSRLVRGQIL
jgi:phosphatidylserine/phosphatidylglycerophosphate/cardiolipin synthase-like enzyme